MSSFFQDASAQTSSFISLNVLPEPSDSGDTFKARPKQGAKICSACKSASYCFKECQFTSASYTLVLDCKSHLKSGDWKPAWVVKRHSPTSLSGKNEGTRPQWTWSTQRKANKTRATISQLHLLFPTAASGDFRHVVQTNNALPEDYSGHLQVYELLYFFLPPTADVCPNSGSHFVW
ncbi:hypothetical protein EDB19DRAFT_1828935 [Suillus lakei]|nr:hypothetical protein EDB19DRAFT_1828935 [Suillus lakei]